MSAFYGFGDIPRPVCYLLAFSQLLTVCGGYDIWTEESV
jgi:hypothetical protein